MSLNRFNGGSISRSDYISQAIDDVLSTPIGSRVMRREYGSLLPELIDQPQNAATIQRIIAATASAIKRWIPEVSISRVQFEFGSQGQSIVTIDRTDSTSPLTIPLNIKGAA